MRERSNKKHDGSAGPAKQSGDFSKDPMFDPAELFEVVEREEDLDVLSEAMRQFLDYGDEEMFARSIAVFVRSARTRGETVERVLGTLESLADRKEGQARMGTSERESPLRQRILRGLLLAFYGSDVVERERTARKRRRP